MLYREMFDEVHAPQGLKEEVMNMTRQETTRVVRKVSAAFVIAAVLAGLFGGGGGLGGVWGGGGPWWGGLG